MAETYPGLANAAALNCDLPTSQIKVAKTKKDRRAHACDRLKEVAWIREKGVDIGDLGPARCDEDAFDSHITAAAMLRCVLEDPAFLQAGLDRLRGGGERCCLLAQSTQVFRQRNRKDI